MRFIAIDMDGTLLDSNHTIPKENIDTLKKAQEKGIYAVISTGRVYAHVNDFVKESGFTPDFIISSNGACITDKYGKELFSKPIPQETFRQAIDYLHNNDFFYSISTSEGMISPFDGIDRLKRHGNNLREQNLDDSKVNEFIEFLNHANEKSAFRECHNFDYLYNLELPVFSIPVIGFTNEILEKGKKGLTHLKNVTFDSSFFNNFEIVNKEASKGIAIEFLLDELNISPDYAMALGDNFNDVSMFDVVKYSIAMGNAPDAIKSKCYYTTKTNVEFGVAHAIEKFCL